MGALFGTLTALCIGGSDLFGRRIVNASTPLTAAATIQLWGVLAGLIIAIVGGGELIAVDLAFGLVSGSGMAIGLATYYGGVVRSSATIVAPMTATLSTLLPYGYAAIRTELPSPLAIVGAVVAVIGLVVVSSGGESPSRIRAGVMWGLTAGTAYGLAIASLVEVSEDAGNWPAFSQRVAAFVITAAIALSAGTKPLAPRSQIPNGMLAGIGVGLTALFLLLAVRADPTVAIVTSSIYPAVSVVIGRVFFGDFIRRRQVPGIVAVLLGVILVVLA